MPTLTDPALDYLLASAGLELTEAQREDLKSIHDALMAMKARVRQPPGRMAEPAHTFRFSAEDCGVTILTIAEAARLISAKKLSPVELTRACLSRISAHDETLHAFVLVTEERALADAKAAEAAITRDGPISPLHGIPIGLKDIVDTAGIPTTCQSAILQDNVPEKDATCAARLAAAGSVLMGKLTTHEFADGGPSFDLPKPPAANPWNPDHFTAGSSSGTAAAVPQA